MAIINRRMSKEDKRTTREKITGLRLWSELQNDIESIECEQPCLIFVALVEKIKKNDYVPIPTFIKSDDPGIEMRSKTGIFAIQYDSEKDDFYFNYSSADERMSIKGRLNRPIKVAYGEIELSSPLGAIIYELSENKWW